MASGEYSFIDIAVLDAVRERFAAGDALAILSADLEDVIWANGPGARLFGYPDIEAIMGASAGFGFAQRRQIAATSGFPTIGTDRPVMIRLTKSASSMAVPFLASNVTLPDGELAILLAAPSSTHGDPSETARRAISGFTEAGYFAAFVSQGRIVAATPGYENLAIEAETVAGLVEEVAIADDRLIKKRIPAAGGRVPAGIARLTDEPATHLLVVVNDPELYREEDFPPVPDEVGDDHRPETDASDANPTATAPADRSGTQPDRNGHIDEWYFAGEAAPGPAAASTDIAIDDVSGQDPDDSPAGSAPSLVAQGGEPAPVRFPSRDAAPIRFAWRTDAQGRFSSISPEFLQALATPEESVIGHSFAEVAQTLAIDPQGEIGGLLERRDTWSGKTVHWPSGSGGFRVPVDLAALPVYARDRAFEGFRGFGIARLADAVEDVRPGVPRLVTANDEVASPGAQADDASREDETRAAEAPETKDFGRADAEADVSPVDNGVPLVEEEDPEAPAPGNDPFRGETPVIAIEEARNRRYSDKIIRLAEHRAPHGDRVLSAGERNAFREIGDRLKDVVNPRKETEAGSKPQSIASEPDRTGEEESSVALAGRNDDRDRPETPPEAGAPQNASSGEPDLGLQDPLASEIDQEAYFEVEEEFLEEPLPAEEIGDRPLPPDDLASATQPEPAAQPEIVEFADGDRKPAAAAGEIYAGVMFELSAAESDRPPGEGELAQSSPLAEPQAPDRSAEQATPLDAPLDDHELQSAPVDRGPAFVPSAFAEPAASVPTGIEESFLAGLPSPVLVHAGDALHFANPAFFEMTEYESLRDLEEAGGLGELFAEPYGEEGTTQSDEAGAILRTRSGKTFPVRAHLQSIPWHGGKALLLALARLPEAAPHADASDRHGGQLDSRVEEMRTILDTATDGVVLIASDGTIRSINRPAEALFGWDDREIAGKPFSSLFAVESQRSASDYLEGLSDNGVASVLNDGREVIGREAQGRFIPLFMTIGRLPGGNGFCAVLRDITQWKRAEEELTQARSMAERASSQKSEFLARVSHEIRTPLNAIIGFSELMMDEKFGPIGNDRYRDYLRDINRSGNHVLDLVNDLLDISKIEAGEQEMNYEAVSLNEILAETVAMMQPQANRERVIIRSSFASRLPDIVADLRSIRQIGLNLLSNAVRFTHPGGQVIVSTAYESSGDVVMRVRDTGVGMSQAEIEQALKPFKQINSLKRKRTDGTGLGLPLTKAMVEANRARFAINSTPGEGTLVEVTFPSARVLAD